ncbi:MAG TPA: DUF2306 domain-containing protein [Rhizomicrobium sp.]|jgi:hypothetical protein
MENGLVKLGRYALTFLAAGIAVHAMRYMAVPANIWIGIDNDIRGVIQHVPLQALTHMIAGPIALLTGPFQFWPRLRARRPVLHRWTGRVYVVSCLVAGVAALATAPFASGGPVAGFGFGLLAVLWIATNVMGWRTALQRNFEQHRIWMRYSYAMTFGAVTLRLQIPFGFIFFGFHSYAAMSVWLAYTAWIPNVIVVALYTLWRSQRAQMPLPVAAE